MFWWYLEGLGIHQPHKVNTSQSWLSLYNHRPYALHIIMYMHHVKANYIYISIYICVYYVYFGNNI